MKQLLFSFLFFLIIGLSISKAQNEIDSTQFYSDLILNTTKASESKEGFNYFEKMLEKYRSEKQLLGEVYILTLIAQIQRNLGLIKESEEKAIEALKLLNQMTYNANQDVYRVSLYNHFGILYKENESYQSSIEYYQRALKLIHDSKKRIITTNNLGNVYREQGDFKLAIKLYNKAYTEGVELGDKEIIARVLNNLGKAQSYNNNPSALSNLERSLRLRQKMGYKNGIISSFLSLGEYYKSLKNNDKALSFAKRALALSNSFNKIQQKLAAIELQCDLGYFENYSEFKILKDSLQQSRRISLVNYAAVKYDKEKEIKRANENELKFKTSELQKEKEKSNKIIFQALGLFTLLTALFLFYILKLKHKKDKLLQVYNTETRISKKVHDEVANDVFQFMSKLQVESNTSEKLIDDIEHIYNKTRDISKEYYVIGSNDNFETILNDLVLSFNSVKTNVIIKGLSNIEWGSISKIKRITIYKILQELLINMKKHSMASVAVLAFNNEGKKITIGYSDNGQGCTIVKGTGLQNVENRITSIKGTIIFESEIDKGFKAQIVI